MERVRRFLETGHMRCEQLLSAAAAAARAGEWNKARDAFDAFVEDLEAHLAMEEDVLFPRLSHDPVLAPLIKRCRLEHAELRDDLAQVSFLFTRDRIAALPDMIGELTRFIAAHNEREEGLARGPGVGRAG